MADSAVEVGSARPKDFENLVEGSARAAAASGQIRRTSKGSSASGQNSTTAPNDSDSASASGAESEKGSAAFSEKGSTVACDIVVDIIFKPGSKIPTCFLCGVQANAPTPLKSGHDLDCFGGLHPWNGYSKVYAEDGTTVIGKTPKGCVCAISRNCYNAIGFNVKYGTTGGGGGSKSKKQSMSKYKKLMAKRDGIEIHTNFMASEKLWIEKHNKNPNGKWA